MIFDADELLAKAAIAAFEAGDWATGLSQLALLKTSLASTGLDARVDVAKNILQRDYCDTRDRIVTEFVREWRAGEFSGSRDSALESLDQSCDSACTYTTDAQLYLAMSRNDDAYVQEFGELPLDDGSIQWGALAMAALRADVLEALQHEDIDINKDPPDEPTAECDGCDEWKVCKDGRCEDCTEEPEEPEEPDDDKDARWRLTTKRSLTVTSYTSIPFRARTPEHPDTGGVTSSLPTNQRL